MPLSHFPNGIETSHIITKTGPVVDARSFGAKFDNSTDDTAAIQAAIDWADTDHVGIQGWPAAVVKFPGGTARISSKLVVPNFVRLEGISARGTKIQPLDSTYSDSEMIKFTDDSGTASLFDSGFSKMWVDASTTGVAGTTVAAITDVILSEGLQENTSINNVIVSSFGTRGITFDPGNGSAHAQVVQAEIGPNDGATGIYCNSTGVTTYTMDRITINGPASTTTVGIDMVKDNAILTSCHFEDCGIGVRLAANTAVTAIGCKGLNTTVSVFQVASASARLELIGCFPNGATNLVDNNWSTYDITRSVSRYHFPDELNASDDATPSVVNDPEILTLTATTGTTTLTGFDDSYNGQKFTVVFIISGGQYDVDFTASNLRGNAGVDWTAVSDGDSMTVTMRNGIGYCQISG